MVESPVLSERKQITLGEKIMVQWMLTEQEAHAVLLLMRRRQDECKKVTADYPPRIYAMYSDLDVHLERLKTKLAGQL